MKRPGSQYGVATEEGCSGKMGDTSRKRSLRSCWCS